MQRRFAPCLVAVLLLASPACLAADRDPISESKWQLMLDLFALTGGEPSADGLLETILAQMERSQGAMLEQVIAGTSGLSPEAQSELRAQLGGAQGFLARLRPRLAEQIDFQQLLQRIVIPIYDRHFDEQELRELLAFYRTPAGRKATSILPQIAQETTEAAAEAVQPQILGLVQEIIAEEAALLAEADSG